MCNSHEIRTPPCFSVCCLLFKSHFTCSSIRYNFESLTVMTKFWKEIRRLGIECLAAFRLLLSAILREPNIIRSSNNYSTNSTFMVVSSQFDGKWLILIYNNIIM